MKKTKILMLVLVISIMAMGAGYAYWSEVLIVNNTISTGELRVEFTKSESFDYDNKIPFLNNYLTVSDKRTENNHKIEFKITDIYPGSGAFLGFKIENKGTVPAKATISSLIHEGAEFKDDFDYSIHSIILHKPVKKTGSIFGFEVDWVEIDVTGELGILNADTFGEFVTGLNDRLGKYTLEPMGYFEINGRDRLLDGTEMGTGYNIKIPKEIIDNNLEDKTFKFDLLLEFQQEN
jgi:hypothetical protein